MHNEMRNVHLIGKRARAHTHTHTHTFSQWSSY